MALVEGFLRLEEVLSLPECAMLPPDGVYHYAWPCGLALEFKVVEETPGAYWACLKEVHRLHHALGHKEAPMIMESVTTSPDLLSVTVTFSCGCKE